MTQDEIIEMARQAGFSLGHNVTKEYSKKLEDFAKLVAAKEREALLDVVYGYARSLSWNEDFQAEIRARGEA